MGAAVDDAERSLLHALNALRDVKSRQQALDAVQEQAVQWKHRYESELQERQRLEAQLAEMHLALESAKGHLQQVQVTNQARRQYNGLRASTSCRARTRTLKLGNSHGRCDAGMLRDCGLLPFALYPAASNISEDLELLQSAVRRRSTVAALSHDDEEPQDTKFVNRSQTVSISGLLSMLMTVNLLQSESSPQPDANTAGNTVINVQTVLQAPDKLTDKSKGVSVVTVSTRAEPSSETCTPTAMTALNTKSHSSPSQMQLSSSSPPSTTDGIAPPSTHQTLKPSKRSAQGENLLESPQSPPSHSLGPVASSVSLVDDDGTSGVGLAAAAAVAAAAARAWAVAASHQQRQTQQRTSNSSGVWAGSAAATAGGSEVATSDVLGSQSSMHSSSSSQLRKSGKAGYKLVASVYREPAPLTAVQSASQLFRTHHAASTQNITALGNASSKQIKEVSHAASTSSLPNLISNPSLEVSPKEAEALLGIIDGTKSELLAPSQRYPHDKQRRATTDESFGDSKVPRTVGFHVTGQMTGVEASPRGIATQPITGDSTHVHGLSLHSRFAGILKDGNSSDDLSSPRERQKVAEAPQGPQPVQQQQQTKQGQLQQPASVISSPGPSRLSTVDKASKQADAGPHSTTPTGSDKSQAHILENSETTAQSQHGIGSAKENRAALQNAANSLVEQPGNSAGHADVQSTPTRSNVNVHAGAKVGNEPMSHLTSMLSDGTSQLMGCFRVCEPTTTPGSQLASICTKAVGHAVPARVAGGLLRKSINALTAGQQADNAAVVQSQSTPQSSTSSCQPIGESPSQQQPAAAITTSSPVVLTPPLRKSMEASMPSPFENATPSLITADSQPNGNVPHQPGMQGSSVQGVVTGYEEQQGLVHRQVDIATCGAADSLQHDGLPQLQPRLPQVPPEPGERAEITTQGPGTGIEQSDQEEHLATASMDLSKSTALTLHWLSPPRTALVMCKLSPAVYPLLNRVLRWLRERSLSVYVEPTAYQHVDVSLTCGQTDSGLQGSSMDSKDSTNASSTPAPAVTHVSQQQPTDHAPGYRNLASLSIDGLQDGMAGERGGCKGVLTWPEGRCPNNSIPDEVAQDLDFVVVLGGDGTLLWTCHVFGNRAVPPLLPFNMGSLGFLTPFPPSHVETMLGQLIQGGFSMILRHRLHATIVRAPKQGKPAGGDVCWSDGHCASEKVVLNEVVVDRGISPFLTNLECYCDGNFVTHGDGLIISTPTGSTAYSLAAGGSMVHPQVPGILFTPVCPHSLSFRPLVFPDHVQLSIQVPEGARAQMYCSFDGKDRQELNAGDAVIIRMSQWPVPTVCSADPSRDWFTGVREGLHWNERRVQGNAGH